MKGTSDTDWNRPALGLAAAKIAHLVERVALIPAFETEILCCSIASCMDDLSFSFILSNSSIAANPRSASARAPASKVQRPSAAESCTAAAVKPAADADIPEVNLPRGDI